LSEILTKLYLKHLELTDIENIDYRSYPFNLHIVKNIETVTFEKAVTFILGENGVGKSTFIEALAVALGLNPEGGTNNSRFSNEGTVSKLYQHIRTIKTVYPIRHAFFLRAESLYLLERQLNSYYEGEDFHAFSHGEGLLNIVNRYFRPNRIFILDEPESALSPTSQFLLLRLIHDFASNHGCQFIIATHSPILAAYTNGDIYELSEDSIVKKSYLDTNLYALYHRFINDDEYRQKIIEE